MTVPHSISTTAMFVAGGDRRRVLAKHEWGCVSSSTGSADVLESLGAAISCSLSGWRAVSSHRASASCLPPNHHGAMKHAELSAQRTRYPHLVPTILGPLTNPAHAPDQSWGASTLIWSASERQVFAATGAELRSHCPLAAVGSARITLSSPTAGVAELKNSEVERVRHLA